MQLFQVLQPSDLLRDSLEFIAVVNVNVNKILQFPDSGWKTLNPVATDKLQHMQIGQASSLIRDCWKVIVADFQLFETFQAPYYRRNTFKGVAIYAEPLETLP